MTGFKVYHPQREKNLEETVEEALARIREKDYDAVLLEKGIKKERIRHVYPCASCRRIIVNAKIFCVYYKVNSVKVQAKDALGFVKALIERESAFYLIYVEKCGNCNR